MLEPRGLFLFPSVVDVEPNSSNNSNLHAQKSYHFRVSADINSDQAAQFYKKAIECYEIDEKYHMSGDTFRTFNAFLVKNGKYLEAVENIKKQIVSFQKLDQPHNIWKAYLSIVILYLSANDWVAADNAYNEFTQLVTSQVTALLFFFHAFSLLFGLLCLGLGFEQQ